MDENRLRKQLLSEEYRQRLMRFVERKIKDHQDIEEVVQDVLMSGLDSLPRFRGQSSLYTWLCSIARHEIADFYRRKKIKQIVFSRLPFLESLVSEALGPELAYQELETKRKILRTLKSLSEGYSQILRLKYIDELSVKEIANNLGQTVKAVESRLFRARLAFQKIYNEDSTRPVQEKKFFKESGEDWSSFRD